MAPDMLPAEPVGSSHSWLVLSGDTPELGLPFSGPGDNEQDGGFFGKSLAPPTAPAKAGSQRRRLGQHGCPSERSPAPSPVSEPYPLDRKYSPSEIEAIPETSAVSVHFSLLTRGNDDILSSNTHTTF